MTIRTILVLIAGTLGVKVIAGLEAEATCGLREQGRRADSGCEDRHGHCKPANSPVCHPCSPSAQIGTTKLRWDYGGDQTGLFYGGKSRTTPPALAARERTRIAALDPRLATNAGNAGAQTPNYQGAV